MLIPYTCTLCERERIIKVGHAFGYKINLLSLGNVVKNLSSILNSKIRLFFSLIPTILAISPFRVVQSNKINFYEAHKIN